MIFQRPPHLKDIWVERPLFFITSVTKNRKKILASDAVHKVFIECWHIGFKNYGWATIDYVIMPDHVHFICKPEMDTNLNLSDFVGRWKSYTARELSKRKIIEEPQVWQSGFFDRLLRNENEWGEKYQYMLQNPVRAGLVSKTTDWPYKGSLQL